MSNEDRWLRDQGYIPIERGIDRDEWAEDRARERDWQENRPPHH